MALGQEVILETHTLVKAFKGFVAVDGVSLRVRRGEVHALIGPNGAGKTTFFNLLTKFLQPTSGTIFYRGTNITREKPADIARRGVVRSFQICAVFPHLTVLENVRVALQRSLNPSFYFWRSAKSLAKLDDRAMQLRVDHDLQRLEDFIAVHVCSHSAKPGAAASTIDPGRALRRGGRRWVERVVMPISRCTMEWYSRERDQRKCRRAVGGPPGGEGGEGASTTGGI